jgi:hypothetical protein
MDLSAVGIQTNFSALDWCIVIGYLFIIVGIGVYIKRYVHGVTDFIVAGRGGGFVLMPPSSPYGREITPRTMTNYETMVRPAVNFRY